MVVPDLLEMLEVWYLRDLLEMLEVWYRRDAYSPLLHSCDTLVSQASSGGACWRVL